MLACFAFASGPKKVFSSFSMPHQLLVANAIFYLAVKQAKHMFFLFLPFLALLETRRRPHDQKRLPQLYQQCRRRTALR